MDIWHTFFIADVPGAILCVVGAVVQVLLGRRLRVPAPLSCTLSASIVLLYFVARESRRPSLWRVLPPVAHSLIPPLIVLWSFCVVCVGILVLIRDAVPPFRSERRQFLRKSTAALCVTPAAVLLGAVITRKDFRVNEFEITFPDLPKDLSGLRLLQISDIHLGKFFTPSDLARVVDISNNLRADIVFVTGDLITTPWDPLDTCLHELRRLRSNSGIWGCMGNHELYCRAQAYTEAKARQLGIFFLRHQSVALRFGASTLNLVGVDYQPLRDPYLTNVENLVLLDSFNLLLSHNPDVFPKAAEKGFDLVLGGHTHGGQVNVEILGQNLNLAEFFTPYTRGLYTLPASSIYVNSGLGTIGMPVRLGAPPEIALIRLSGVRQRVA